MQAQINIEGRWCEEAERKGDISKPRRGLWNPICQHLHLGLPGPRILSQHISVVGAAQFWRQSVYGAPWWQPKQTSTDVVSEHRESYTVTPPILLPTQLCGTCTLHCAAAKHVDLSLVPQLPSQTQQNNHLKADLIHRRNTATPKHMLQFPPLKLSTRQNQNPNKLLFCG